MNSTISFTDRVALAERSAQSEGRVGVSLLEVRGLAEATERYEGTAGLSHADQQQMSAAASALRHWTIGRINTAEKLTGGGTMFRVMRASESAVLDEKLTRAGAGFNTPYNGRRIEPDFPRMYFSSMPEAAAEKADLAVALKAVDNLPAFPRNVLMSHMVDFADRNSWAHLRG